MWLQEIWTNTASPRDLYLLSPPHRVIGLGGSRGCADAVDDFLFLFEKVRLAIEIEVRRPQREETYDW
jgi:hypothetical protein